jgi:hypothetical protein
MRASKSVIAYLIIGALMVGFCGCSGLNYEKYSSKDSELNITLEHVLGWKVVEQRGSYNSYVQAMFYPTGKSGDSQAMMVVLAEKSPESAAGPITIEQFADDFVAKRMQFKDAKVLSRSKVTFLGGEAVMVEISYMSLEDLLKVNSKLIGLKEKTLAFKKDGIFYSLNYRNSAEGFGKFEAGFAHLVKTFRFKK